MNPAAPTKRLNLFKGGFIAIYGVVCAPSPGTYRSLDRVGLVFREAGHVLFGFFGGFIGILGGSLMQVLIPAGIVVYFAMRRQNYSAAVTLFWVGQSLLNVSVYAKDARARALPLLGGEDTLHDWGYILGKLNLLRWGTRRWGTRSTCWASSPSPSRSWGDSTFPGRNHKQGRNSPALMGGGRAQFLLHQA